jgi:hypothetical protein
MSALTSVRGTENGPTAVEGADSEAQMPKREAAVDVLDVEISSPVRPASQCSERRARRSHRQLLAARLALANHPAGGAL